MADSRPLLLIVQASPRIDADLAASFREVWGGRIATSDVADVAPRSPALVVVSSREPSRAFDLADRMNHLVRQVPVLAVVHGAKGVRRDRTAPRGVTWVASPSELEPRLLSAVVRFSIERSERIRLQERLERRDLEDLGWLFNTMFHEISNPLTSLLANLELLQTMSTLSSLRPEVADLREWQQLVNDAYVGALHLSRVARDVGRASGHGGRQAPVDVGGVISAARRLACLAQEGVDVRVQHSDSLAVFGDETRLCQVLLNLLRNASRALAEIADPVIHIAMGQVGEEVLVRVSDNGPGISAMDADRVFRLGFSTRPQGGGVGLALSRRYIEEMGGTLTWVRGSCFEIRLPAVDGVEDRPTLIPDRIHLSGRILVVDDTPMVARAIARSLADHEVVVTHTLEEATAAVAGDRFDVALIDMRMPGGGGREIYEMLVETLLPPLPQVVFLSGGFREADLAFLEQHNLPWVRKPIGVNQLRGLVAEMLADD